jgi:hypothetical protein
MFSRWRPLNVRDSADMAKYDGPFEGVPDHLYPLLLQWVTGNMPRLRHQGYMSLPGVTAYRAMAAALRTSFDDRRYPDGRAVEQGYHTYVSDDPFRLLNAASWVLHHVLNNDNPGFETANQLDGMLSTAGSVWEVKYSEYFYLSKRVTEEMAMAADKAMSARDRASEHLKRAWREVYSKERNPGSGYSEAVKAVEAAAIPVVSPKNPTATLGTVIAEMRNAPQNFRVGLFTKDPVAQTQAFIGELALLWQGHLRHGDGNADPLTPIDVSQEEAEAALHLAIQLVKWFRDGTIRHV